MKDEAYNPLDPLFLASKGLDEPLDDDEQRTLDEALARDPLLAAEVESLRKVHEAVRAWTVGSIDLDWAAHAGLVNDRIDDENAGKSDADAALDRLLGTWAADRPAVTAEEYVAAVMERIDPRAARGNHADRRRGRAGVLLRIGLPLAAAAAIALLVVPVFREPRHAASPTLSPTLVVEWGRSTSSTPASTAAPTQGQGSVTVRFGRAKTTTPQMDKTLLAYSRVGVAYEITDEEEPLPPL